MSEMNKVGVVVVNYNSSLLLGRLLSSLGSEQVAEIIVWDNGSSPHDAEMAAALANESSAHFYASGANLGFGAAVNGAIACLREICEDLDYFWILNPDTIVRPGAAQTLCASAKRHGYDLLSPLIVCSSKELLGDTVWYSGGRVDRRAGRSVHHRIGKPVGAADTGSEEVSFVTGAAMFVRAEAWEKLGGFDRSLFLYCEDAELSIRANCLGLRLGVERAAVVEHDEGGSSGGRASPTFYYYVQRNRLTVYRRWNSRLGLVCGRGLGESLRLLLLPLRGGGGRRFKSLIASVQGLMAGLGREVGQREPGRREPSGRIAGDSASVLQVYVEARTAHLERLVQNRHVQLLYRRVSYDFDDTLATNVGARRSTFLGLLRSVFTTSASTIETNEPAMARAFATTVSLLTILRLRRMLGLGGPRVVSYAIENATPAQVVVQRLRLPESIATRITGFAMRHVLSRYDRVAFGTDGSRKLYETWLHTSRSGPSTATFEALEPACPSCIISPESSTVLFVGSFERRKGFDLLLEAWPSVQASRPGARLILLGKGPLEDAARRAAAAEDSIQLEINPSRLRIHEVLSTASVLVLYSRRDRSWREQVGLPIIEGLSHGCTVVTSSETGIADWLREQGHWVESADVDEVGLGLAIQSALENALDPDVVRQSLPHESCRSSASEWLWRGGDPL